MLEKLKPILRFIPGFRTQKSWKMIIASLYYLIASTSLLAGLPLFLIMLLLPQVFFSFLDLFIFKSRKISFKQAISTFLVATVLIFVAAANIDSTTKPTSSNNASKAVATSSSEKENKTTKSNQQNQETKTPTTKNTATVNPNNNNSSQSIAPTKTLGELKIHFIDVGQADSILVQSENKSMLIDAGNNADSDLVVDYINKLGIKHLDYVIGSHPHEDHIGGLDVVINSFDIGKVMLPKATSTTDTYKDVLTAIKNKGLKITLPTPSTTFELGDSKCTVLAPNSSEYEDVNDYSIVIKVVHGSKSFLLTADAEQISETEMLEKGYDLKADVLKVGHHGSKSSTSYSFLDKVHPLYAVISVGDDNKYGHPTQETLDRLKSRNIPVYRTDESGAIILSSDGKNIKFYVAAGSYKGHQSSSKVQSTSSSASPKQNSNSNNTVVVTKPSKTISRTAYWTPRGKSYHFNTSCKTLKRSKTILSGSLSDAISSGHEDPCNWCAQ